MVEIRGFMGKAEGLWEPWGQGQGHGGDKGQGGKGARGQGGKGARGQGGKGPCGIMGDLGGVAWFGRVL